MTKENQEKMITAMQMMKEACNSVTAWADCDKCPFGSFCTNLQHHAIEFLGKYNYDKDCPMAWKPDKVEEE